MEIQVGYLPQTFLLILARVTAMIGGVAFFGRIRVPARFRVTMAFAVTLLFMPVIPPAWVKAGMAIATLPDLVFAIMGEILLGAAMALVGDIFLSLFVFAGYLIGFGSSLTMAQTLDPVGGGSDNIVGGFLQMVFLILFLISDGHLVLLRLLFGSFSAIPPNMGWLNDRLVADILSLGSVFFVWGLKLAAPVVAVIFVLDLSMGLISRMAPDFDILFLSLPFKLIAGVTVLGLILRYGGSAFTRLEELTLSCYGRLLSP